MSSGGIERRRFVRLGLRLNLSYRILQTKKVGSSLTHDLSAGGVRFVAEHPLEPGTQLECAIRLPDRSEPVRFIGTVVWSQPARNADKMVATGASEVGVQFTEIDSQTQSLIQQYATMYPPPAPEA